MGKIINPVLRGFHPDPSILFVDGWFYVANSTFEWFPGVEVHRSRDLVSWEFAARPLADRNLLDLCGIPRSGGVWAPCLSYADGRFWLIFSRVKTWSEGPFCDVENYLTTSENMEGPWSSPVFLNGSGIDPSLFHDTDGKKYLVNAELDYRRPGGVLFTGILLQEYDPKKKALVQTARRIFRGTELGVTEGPHLYKKEGWYYLMTAEGGTEYGHAITIARSKEITGPYEVHPENPLITSKGDQSLELQKAGHGSWCEGPGGQWVLAYLVGRPLPGTDRCVLGRETAVSLIEWRNGWPFLKGGGGAPRAEFEVPWQTASVEENGTRRYSFNKEEFSHDFMTLRLPKEKLGVNISERPGYLRLYGGDSICSRFEQSLVARRQEDFSFRGETKMEFAPVSFQQMAGLIYRYNEKNQYYLRLSYDQRRESRVLGIIVLDNGEFTLSPGEEEIETSKEALFLAAEVRYKELKFFYREDAQAGWKQIGDVFDASILSDEYADLGFTGAFIGLACQDMVYRSAYADFEYFSYAPL